MPMNGQTKSYKEKQNLIDEFIERVNPYERKEPLRFNLREYSRYIDENNIDRKNVPESVMKMFSNSMYRKG